MKIKKINTNTFEIIETLFSIKVRKYEVVIGYDETYRNFKNYNPIYYKDNGEIVELFKSMRLQDKIEAFKRVDKWG